MGGGGHQPRRAAEPRNRRPSAGGVRRGVAHSGEENRSLPAGNRRLRRGDDLSLVVASAWREGGHSDRARLSACDGTRCGNLRAAEPEREERELLVRRNAGCVRRAAAGDQCAAAGPAPARGRRIIRISGTSTRKIPPSRRNSSTNETIDACCCTIPKSAA